MRDSGGGGHRNRITAAIQKNGLSNGRLVADFLGERIGLGCPDDRVCFRLIIGSDITDGDMGTNVHFLSMLTMCAFDNEFCILDLLLEFHDAAFDKRLIIFRFFVLGVLGEVAVGYCLFEAESHLFSPDCFEFLEFLFELA